jgi:cytochrome c oxidase subunit 2
MQDFIGGVQSSLSPSAREAERIDELFWWMAGGAVLVWLAVIALTIYCIRVRPERRTRRRDGFLIIGGGALVPTLMLTVLLVHGLTGLPPLVAPAPEGSLNILVTGEQWWWRVRYQPPAGPPVDLANEIRLPVGEPVQFRLESDNVIHSFWVPSLAGKIDMIPGRTTRLTVHPTATGIFRGACAEYCGTAHAMMSFFVEVMPKAAFQRWLAHQAEPAQRAARPPGDDMFLASGCGACHTIRGTAAAGVIGPDLTHVASRMSLAAGILPNGPNAFRRWISRTDAIKPGAHMPPFGMLPDGDLRALADYLAQLE